jgi:multidrug resistance efflux pump
MFPRVRLPGAVEIGGTLYPLENCSLGGFLLRVPGPPAAEGEPVRATLHLGEGEMRLALSVTARVLRTEDGRALAFQFIDLAPEVANLLDRLVEDWLAGGAPMASVVAARLGAPPAQAERAAGQARLQVAQRRIELPRIDRRLARAGTILVGGFVLLGLLAGFMLSSRLVVYSEFGAVSAPLHLVRAPVAGIVTLSPLAIGTQVAAGAGLGEILPAVPPQVNAALEPQIQGFEGRMRQLEGELAASEAGFIGFRRQVEAELAAATQARQLLERQVATQERMYQRLAGLARQGYVSAARADQEEINLLHQRRLLAEAIAAEGAARNQASEAEQGRFRTDGRPLARPPEEVRRELAGVRAQLEDARRVLARITAAVPLPSPCACVVAQLGTTPGSAVLAGDALLGLAGADRSGPLEVDALVPSARMPFLRSGQEVTVHLGGADAPVTGRITALNYNPENSGRVGLPDNLRTLRSYGLVTVTLPGSAQGARTGLPALVAAPIHLRMLALNLPGFGWFVGAGRP